MLPRFAARPPIDELLSLWESLIVKQGVTTAPGDPAGNSIKDASLIGSGVGSFSNMPVVLYPGDPKRVDSMFVTAGGFDNTTGEVTLDKAYKSIAAPIPAGVPYTMLTTAASSVAGLAAILALVTAIKTVTDLLPDGGALTALLADIASILTDTGTTLPGLLATIAGYIDTEVADIKTQTDKLGDGTIGLAALKTLLDAIIGYIDTEVADIKTQTDKLANIEHETEWGTTPASEQIASAAETDLTAGSITPTFPTGSTPVRAILISSIHAANQGANTHHIGIKVKGQKAGGGYSTLLDLTTHPPLGLQNVDGSGDGWSGALDVTVLVDTSGVPYDFRFAVDSDNAGAVIYTTGFVLVFVYKM